MRKYNIVTIERQFASGGREIGRLLAKKLDFKFHNENIIEMTAAKLGITVQEAADAEEVNSSSLLYYLALASAENPMFDGLQLSQRMYVEESAIIKDLALREPCVIVGRSAGQILSERKDCLNVFVYADEKSRIARAVNEYGVREKDALSVLYKNDKRRRSFYNAHNIKKWDCMETYDLCLNSGIGIEFCAQMIAGAISGDQSSASADD